MRRDFFLYVSWMGCFAWLRCCITSSGMVVDGVRTYHCGGFECEIYNTMGWINRDMRDTSVYGVWWRKMGTFKMEAELKA